MVTGGGRVKTLIAEKVAVPPEVLTKNLLPLVDPVAVPFWAGQTRRGGDPFPFKTDFLVDHEPRLHQIDEKPLAAGLIADAQKEAAQGCPPSSHAEQKSISHRNLQD